MFSNNILKLYTSFIFQKAKRTPICCVGNIAELGIISGITWKKPYKTFPCQLANTAPPHQNPV